MGRRSLPGKEDPVRRRRAVFRNIFLNYFRWLELVQSEEHFDSHPEVLEIDEEPIYFKHLLVGYGELPQRQREAFDLHLLQGMSETEAAREMGFTKWSTPVQQYCNMALDKMIKTYDKAVENERSARFNPLGEEKGVARQIALEWHRRRKMSYAIFSPGVVIRYNRTLKGPKGVGVYELFVEAGNSPVDDGIPEEAICVLTIANLGPRSQKEFVRYVDEVLSEAHREKSLELFLNVDGQVEIKGSERYQRLTSF